ncbi:STAS domain-containing protein [Candidatus Mycobacterium wuenschmannii]|uniref:STAS domain-containing protein n=1 Tax=Candidatus Mycobacterium wuenschmannii TaxID=3027808 RepID=A0ABY8VVE0_9MYCO|nr:STAS domain-containing protein [Candidatus Mycobacterium wuenschmannii]WIM86744.1 STAS domain-containing protein [Candidatus Mycobacterium wuenschmannii]
MNGPSPLKLAERTDGDAVVISAEGIVDMAAAPTLTEQIRAALRRRPAVLIIDLTKVTFLATAGMSVLMETDRTSKERSIVFRVVADGPVTVMPMQLLGIDDLLAIYPTVDAAREGLPPSTAPAH